MLLNHQLTNSFNQRTGCPDVQAWLDGLNFAAKALRKAGTQPSQFLDRMADQVAAAERATKQKVRLRNGTIDGRWFMFGGNHGPNHARVSKPNAVRWLSARIAGVVMSANFHKPGVCDHENVHVAQALRALADAIEKAPIRLADNDIELSVDR